MSFTRNINPLRIKNGFKYNHKYYNIIRENAFKCFSIKVMKLLKISICFISFILFGCVGSQEIIHKEYKFERMYNDNHIFTFEIYLENFKNPKKLSKLIKELIYNGKNFDEFRENTEQKFVQDVIKNNYPEAINEDGTARIYHSDLNENYSIVFNDERFVIIENKLWFYASGMAHGNYSVEYYIVDLLEKKILNKNDLINQVPDKLLEENIAEKHETNNFLRKNIWPPDTLNFHDGAVELIWNTYSILPYVEGIISVELKDEVIEQYLTKRGRELLIKTDK